VTDIWGVGETWTVPEGPPLAPTITVLDADDSIAVVLQNDSTGSLPFMDAVYHRDLTGLEELDWGSPGNHQDSGRLVNQASVAITINGDLRLLRIGKIVETVRGVARTTDTFGRVTAMLAVGKDGSGNRIGITAAATSAIHPAGAQYVQDVDALNAFGLPYVDGGALKRRHIYGFYDHGEDAVSAADLVTAAYAALQAQLEGMKTYELVDDDGSHTKHVYCEAAMNELLGVVYLGNPNYTSTPYEAVVSEALTGATGTVGDADYGPRWTLGTCVAGSNAFPDLTDATALAWIQAARELSGGEIDTRYTEAGGRITARTLSVVDRLGADNGVLLSSAAVHVGIPAQNSGQGSGTWAGEVLGIGDTAIVDVPEMTPPAAERVRVCDVTDSLSSPGDGTRTLGAPIPLLTDH
jgi:hypothetical protein